MSKSHRCIQKGMIGMLMTLGYLEDKYKSMARRTGAVLREIISFRAYLKYRAGKKRYQERHYEAAKRLLLAVLRANPRHFMTNVYLGRIYTKLENFSEASKRYRMAQEVDPVVYRELGLIREHVEALKLGAKRGMVRDALGSMEECGYFLTELGQWAQETRRKQQQSRDGHSAPDEGRSRGKGTWRGVRPGSAPSARVYPLKSDFESFKEFKKFAEMPPISEEEFRDVDWDELLGDN